MPSPSKSVELPQGTIRYRDTGSGEPIVFVHGVLVNGTLWRKVVPHLEPSFRCICPDLPLGGHRVAMRADADLSPPGVARLLADFLAALELDRVTLVANDTGGAISQILAARHPERIGRLVLTPCDTYDNFLPPMYRYLQVAARVPGALFALMQLLRLPSVRRLPFTLGWLTKRPIEREVVDAWLSPIVSDREICRDAAKFLRGISRRQTIEAAERLRSFDRPTLIAFAPEDRFFKPSDAERLAREIPNARLERIESSYSFAPEDQPGRVAELVRGFVAGDEADRRGYSRSERA